MHFSAGAPRAGRPTLRGGYTGVVSGAQAAVSKPKHVKRQKNPAGSPTRVLTMSHRCRIMKKPQAPPVRRRRRPGQGSSSERDPPGTDRTRPETRWRRWGLGPRSGARGGVFRVLAAVMGAIGARTGGSQKASNNCSNPDTLLPAGHPSSWGEQKASNNFSNGSGGLLGAMDPEQGFAEVLTIKAITKPAETPAGGVGRPGRPAPAGGTGLESGSQKGSGLARRRHLL